MNSPQAGERIRSLEPAVPTAVVGALAEHLRHLLYTRAKRRGARSRLHSTHPTAETCRHAGLDLRGVGVWFSTAPADAERDRPPSPH